MNNISDNPFIYIYSHFYTILLDLIKHFNGQQYTIIPIPEFYQELRANPTRAMQTYWTEILYRAHLAAATSLMRTKLWLDGCFDSFEKANFLSFAANLRGLLEATADSCYALKPVPTILAENFTKIVDSLRVQHDSQQLITSRELEDRLIHFFFASEFHKNSNVPKSHRRKTTRDYLVELQGKSFGPIFDLYSELCELSHPSMASLAHLVRNINTREFEIRGYDGHIYIERLCKHKKDSFMQMTAGINASLLTLRTLNEFSITSLHTTAGIFTKVDIPGWSKIESILSTQRS